MYKVFLHENVSENIVCEKADISSSGRRVNKSSVLLYFVIITMQICSFTRYTYAENSGSVLKYLLGMFCREYA